jgi:hypothetical protein
MDGWMASANRGVKMTPKECLFSVFMARCPPFKAFYCIGTVRVMSVQTSEDAFKPRCFFVVLVVIDIVLFGFLFCLFVCLFAD